MKLTNMAAVARLSLNTNTPLTIVKGGNFEQLHYKLAVINGHKDVLQNSQNARRYLLDNFEDMEFLLSLCTEDKVPSKLDLLLSLPKSDLQEPISAFTKEDMEMLFQSYEDSSLLLQAILHLYRLARVKNFHRGNKRVDGLFDHISYSDAGIVAKTIISLAYDQPEKLKPIFCLENFKMDPTKFAESIEALNDPTYLALVRYLTRFVEVSSEDMEGVKAKATLNSLTRIFLKKVRVLTEDHENAMERIISAAMNCHFDGKYLSGFFKNVDEKFFSTEMNVLDFVNVALGNKYHDLIEVMPRCGAFENLLIYALSNKKFAFLDMLSANTQVVLDLWVKDSRMVLSSMFLDADTYKNVLNLNEINKKDLVELLTIPKKHFSLTTLEGTRMRITPKELIALAKSGKDGISRLYEKLTCKVDEKILIVRQFNNADFGLEQRDISNEAIRTLASKLSEKNVARRIEQMGYEVSPETVLKVLILPETFDDMVKQATSEIELQFILRNEETMDLAKSLAENMDNFMQMDVDCKELFKLLDLSNDFLKKYASSIKDFCLKGNASIVMTYYNGVPRHQQESILLIAKAAMSDRMREFKFSQLDKELEYEITSKAIDVWATPTSMKRNGVYTYETYSFDDTMLIGVKPGHTCMNYSDGGYRSCLISNFDSNKIPVFARYNGAIVGRAIIRLTKSLKRDEMIDRKVKFIDVESDNVDETTNMANERLTVFVEKPYFGGVNETISREIRKQFLEIAKEKARLLNARCLASYNYGDCGYEQTNMNVFISHTKNGVQYLDSLGGQNNASNEASYNSCTCYKVV